MTREELIELTRRHASYRHEDVELPNFVNRPPIQSGDIVTTQQIEIREPLPEVPPECLPCRLVNRGR